MAKETKIVEVFNLLKKLEELGFEKKQTKEIVKILDRISIQDKRFDEQSCSYIDLAKRNQKKVNFAIALSIISLIIAVVFS